MITPCCKNCRNLVKGAMTVSDGLSACRLGHAYDFLPDIHSCEKYDQKPPAAPASTAARDAFLANYKAQRGAAV